MNAKKCKKLRKEARVLSIGLPERRLLGHKKIKSKDFYRITVTNDLNTTRGMYLKLKRAS